MTEERIRAVKALFRAEGYGEDDFRGLPHEVRVKPPGGHPGSLSVWWRQAAFTLFVRLEGWDNLEWIQATMGGNRSGRGNEVLAFEGLALDELKDVLSRVISLLRNGAKPHFLVYPDEIDEAMSFPEGAVRKVSVNAYERNMSARTACLAPHGSTCAVCGFDFGHTYGAMGEGFIHVHHLKPLAVVNARYDVNPVRDLCPICPNCHAMVHQTEPPMPIEELRQKLSGKSGG